MVLYIIKVFISAIAIVAITEISKRNSIIAAFIASIPTISVLSFIWLYIEKKDVQQISNLSYNILWLVIPSLVFFVLLPVFLKYKLNFWLSMVIALLVMIGAYFGMLAFMAKIKQ